MSLASRITEFVKATGGKAPRSPWVEYDYRDFRITGKRGRWFVQVDAKKLLPQHFTTRSNAEAAIDLCWKFRAELDGRT